MKNNLAISLRLISVKVSLKFEFKFDQLGSLGSIRKCSGVGPRANELNEEQKNNYVTNFKHLICSQTKRKLTQKEFYFLNCLGKKPTKNYSFYTCS